jgi:hypothetical protein
MFLQAGGGNVGPLRGFLGEIEEVERDGTVLGLEAVKTFLTIDTRYRRSRVISVIESGAPLGIVHDESIPPLRQGFDWIVREVALPLNRSGSTVYDSVEADLAAADRQVDELQASGAAPEEIQKAIQRRLRHQLRLDRKRIYYAAETFPIAVRALRLCDVCFVSVACEAYAEIAVAVRAASPFEQTVFAAYEGADVIYVAPREYFRQPVPMEILISPFGEAAAEVLVEQTASILKELAERNPASQGGGPTLISQ